MADKDNEKEVTPAEVKEAVDSLRDKVKKYGEDSSEAKEMAAKVEKTFEQSEVQHKELVAGQAEEIKQRLALEERVKDFEIQIAKQQSNVKVNHRDSLEYKSLEMMIKSGVEKMTPDEIKTLRMDDSTAGGYLTTTEMDNMIIKPITEISPVRQISRVKVTTKKTLEVPKRDGIPVATYEGEAASGDDDNSTYGSEQLTVYRQTVTVPYTMDLLMDSVFNLENEIQTDVAEAFAFGEGNKFVLGTGSKQPEGFLVHPDIISGARLSETADVITGDDMLLMTGDLKVGYLPMYGFNRQTLAKLRTLKGTDGHYLWQAGLAPGAPNTIGGEPYAVIQDMPSIVAGALPVIYGDFMRGYLITDRTGMVIIRDELTKKKFAIVEVTFHRWNTGQVVLAEAFKALEIKA